ncbi:MAG: hypothetical protein IJC79_02420 [Clostridia bacterium]|nr:hypothetical protein [Clostridia bacterium]
MDTRSTKFNGRFIVKIIAVFLALTVVGFTAKGAIDALFYIENQENFDDDYYFEGFFATQEDDFYVSETFDRQMREYLLDLNKFIYIYGDGTKESYEKRNEENRKEFENYKSNLLNNIYYYLCQKERYTDTVFCLIDEDIVKLTLLEKSDSSVKKSVDLMDIDVTSELITLCKVEKEDLSVSEFEKNSAKAKSYNADLIVTLPQIRLTDYYETNGTVIEAGTYALSVDNELLLSALISEGRLGFTGTYEEYVSDRKEDAFNKSYKNINYIVTEDDGTVITNVKNYTEQQASVSQYEFYITGSDGEYFSNKGSTYVFDEHYEDLHLPYYTRIRIEHRPTSVHEVHTAVPTTMPETTDATTYKVTQYTDRSSSAGVADADLVVYFNSDAVFYGESLAQMKANLMNAGSFSRSAIINVVLGIGFYLAALILLVILSGRRNSEDDTVYLLPTDKIFIEFKLLISAGLIFFAGLLAFTIIDEYRHMSYSFSQFCLGCLPVLVAIVAGLVMEFILSLAKMIKAKRFIKSLFIVWLIKKPVKLIIKMLKKIFSLILMPGKAFIKLCKDVKEKLYYTKNIKKIVIVKTEILVGINLICGIICLIFLQAWGGIDHLGELLLLLVFAAPAIFSDVFALLRGLKFVGGVDRLLEVLGAYRKGNLDTYINRAALPDYLIPAAEDLEELGDGIRIAVEEAVRQETTKTELITNISHDLKTPLTSIINYVELLKHCDIQNETALSYLEVLGEKSDRLKYLISDLVEASKAATGNIEVSLIDVSLKEMLAQIIGENSDAFDEKKLSIVCDLPETDIIVRADSKLLYRVLENLIANVRKYAMESTRVYISAERKEGKGIITLKNISAAPLNISPEELKQRFVRGDASRTTEGNGLGLSIAENLCLLQNGKLDIDIVGDLFIAKVELEAK